MAVDDCEYQGISCTLQFVYTGGSFPVFSTHFPSLLNLIEINPLCQPNQRAPSVREETQLHREGEYERKAVEGKD